MSGTPFRAGATAPPTSSAVPSAPFDAVVLAGGRGSRLGGRDKATIDVGGRTLLEGVLDAVGHAQQTVVVGPIRAGLDNVVAVCEDPPGGGPVAALAAAVSSVSTDTLVVLATDLPFVTRVVIDHLRATLASVPGAGAAVAVDDAGRPQWLLAVWRVDALRHALACVGRPDGRSLRDLGGHVEVTATTMPGGSRRELPVWFDIDTVEELARARRAWARPAARD
jgi:molybdopterin-guanine dinucleotide biosynthesis protein A